LALLARLKREDFYRATAHQTLRNLRLPHGWLPRNRSAIHASVSAPFALVPSAFSESADSTKPRRIKAPSSYSPANVNREMR
jgi:hypothetical protein